MSTDNLILTEHAIKRHAKRLQKQMKNYNQDLSLGESQNLLSKILGFNDWNHLNTILKPAIENYEKELSNLKSKAKNQDDLINSINNTHSKTFFVYKLDLNAECFSDDYINNLSIEKQENFIELKNNFQNYLNQNKSLDKLNLEFAQLLSTFPVYTIRCDYMFSEVNIDYLLREQRDKAIIDIINFSKNNQQCIDFNIVSKEGLNLLAILLIYSAHFEPHFKLKEELKNKILELIDVAIPKTNLNKWFIDFSHFIVLFFDNFFTRNNKAIINKFLKNINEIPENFLPYFLKGNCRVIPNINLLKNILKKVDKKQSVQYISSAINGLIYKPEYFKYNQTDYSQARAILQFLINEKYFYDIKEIQENIIIRLNRKIVDNYEITDNIKYIIDCIPELMTSEFTIQLKNTIKQNDDYSKYFIKILKLNK